MITDLEKERFTDYVNEFYNKGYGIYPIATSEEIDEAISEYFEKVENGDVMKWGGGDSFDRETVRTILEPNHSIFIPA